jgi:hypothetical protein
MTKPNVFQIYNPVGSGRICGSPYYCPENQFYKHLSSFVFREKKLPIIDNLAPDSGYEKLSMHSLLSRQTGYSQSCIAYAELARVSAQLVKQYGVTLSQSAVNSRMYELAALYFLMTSAVVYQYSGRGQEIKSFIATKSRELIRSEIKLTSSRFNELDRHCTETEESIMDGKFKCVAVQFNYGRFQSPRCKEINVNKKGAILIPLMCFLQFGGTLQQSLSGGVMRVVYNDAEGIRKDILTTCNQNILQRCNGVDLKGIGELRPDNPVLVGMIDLERVKRVDVPITGIISVRAEGGQQ